MLQRAVEDQLLISNPVSGIKLRSEKETKPKALSIQDQNTFFWLLQKYILWNLFNVAVNTGLRPGELFVLTLEGLIGWDWNEGGCFEWSWFT